MHDHIKKTVEDLLNMISESLALYKSVNTEKLQGSGPNTLNSIIQSKENSLTSLLKEFNRIYPNFKPKSFTISPKPITELYNNMISLENRIADFVQSDLLPNIPSKGHDGIYTFGVNIRSNSESTVVKLNNILNIRSHIDNSYSNIVEAVVPIIKVLEIYEKESLIEQVSLCNKIIEETKRILKEKYSKTLLVYSPSYGDSSSGICTRFNIKLLDFLKLNRIKNPYSKLLPKYLIIITD